MRVMGPDELGRLVDRHAPALVLYARQWCSAPEDVVQEAFLKLVAQKPPPRDALAWLYCVVRRMALTASRSEQRRRRHEGVAAGRASPWFTPDPVGGLDGDAAAAALRALPAEEREVIVARLWGGLTFEQIGELTGSSSSTVHRRYVAGLSALRERLRVPCPRESTKD
jgi:DNA-directed RNA polymerase specialized sigma24 family protein